MSTGELLRLSPRARPDLLIGPAVLRGTSELRPVKDPVTGARYEMRAKEYFVLSRLDGRRSLGEVGTEYAERFGVRLGEHNWQQLLGLLYGRGLLVSEHPAPARPAPREAPAEERASTLLRGRAKLVADAGATIEALHRRTRFVRHRLVLWTLAVLTAAMLTDLGLHTGVLEHDVRQLWHRPALLLAVGVVIWISLGCHELAHGMVGRAFGGEVTEIGMRWRMPATFLYCLVRDLAFFARRREQVATALAGPATNLLFLLPFWPVWALVPRQGAYHYALGGLLVLGVAVAAGNLLPLPPLDGYKALGYALGASQLATDSRLFLRRALASWVRRGDGIGAYSLRMRLVYGGYGLLSGLVSAVVVVAVLGSAAHWLAARYGTAAGWTPVALLALALALWRTGVAARARREAADRRRSAA
jgi:putative peptide zinc metalloprotease protein